MCTLSHFEYYDIYFWYLLPLSSLTMKAETVGVGVVVWTLHVKVSLSVTVKVNRLSTMAMDSVLLSTIFIVAGRFVMAGCLLIRIKKIIARKVYN